MFHRIQRVAVPLVLAASALGQVHLDRVTSYDGEHGWNDNVQTFVQGAQGRLYAAGPSWDGPFPSGVRRGLVIGLDPLGVVSWKFLADVLPGGNHDVEAMGAPATGGVVIGGRVELFPARSRYVIRLDDNGQELWTRVRSGDHRTWAVCMDPSGDVFAGGSDQLVGGSGTDFHVERLDATGAVVWERRLSGSTGASLEEVRDLVPGPTGSVIAAGAIVGSSLDLAVARIAGDGTVLWSRTVPGSGSQSARRVAVDAAGRVFAVGELQSPTVGSTMGVAAFDATGTPLWTRTFLGSQGGNGRGFDIAVDPFGDVVAFGDALTSNGTRELLVVRLDASGNERWRRTWIGPLGFDTTARSLAISPAGDVVAAAFAKTSLDPNGPNDLWLVAWDALGHARWETAWYGDGTPQSGEVPSVVLAPDERTILVGGYTNHGGADSNDFTILAWTRTAVPICTGGPGSPCPCGNVTAADANSGCAHSFGAGGRLVDAGASSLAGDSFVLRADGLPNSTALFFQGTSSSSPGAPFGDGLLCAGGTVVRLGTATVVAGACEYPGPGDPSVSVRGAVGAPGTRAYQVWYRNAAAFCTGATFNLTNGSSVIWTD